MPWATTKQPGSHAQRLMYSKISSKQLLALYTFGIAPIAIMHTL